MFRSKLQTRVKGRDESISELAQSVKKLTRQAYPSATSEIIDVLAIDYFVDALTDTDIRLRLREVGPKSITEAEKIAARFEAHRIADKSRGRQHVRFIEPEQSTEKSESSDMHLLKQEITSLVSEVKDLKKNQNRQQQRQGFNRQNDHDNRNHFQGQHNQNGRYRQNFDNRRNGNFANQQNGDNQANFRNHVQYNHGNQQKMGKTLHREMLVSWKTMRCRV